MQTEDIHKLFLECGSVSIDTRKIDRNSLFVALKGDRFDANTFAAEALGNGASYVIIDNKKYHIDDRTILVNNSLEALQKLAKFHRDYLNLPIVALTGSNGKTTTKEMINIVLSQNFNTKATIGNLNNHIGVPLTLLSFTEETEIGIVEMGANHQKEIEFLCKIASPDFGYITNFGKAHLEGFGGIEGVIKGKSEMYDYLAKNGKSAFVNLDDPIQVRQSKTLNTITFGKENPDAFLSIGSVRANPFVSVDYNSTHIDSHLIGLYNANNINAAIAIGKHFGVEDSQIKTAIESYIPENNRSQLLQKGSNEIILDAYNANPSSMKAAIENFSQLGKKNKVAVLGDMFELGSESFSEHKGIVDLVLEHPALSCHFIGKDFYAHQTHTENTKFHRDFDAFTEYLKTNKLKNKTFLIKGSRGMALERVLDFLG